MSTIVDNPQTPNQNPQPTTPVNSHPPTTPQTDPTTASDPAQTPVVTSVPVPSQEDRPAVDSIDDIASGVFGGDLDLINPQTSSVPLGDGSTANIPASPTQTTPASSSSTDDVLKSLDDLESEVGAAALEGKSPESIRSFEGLKGKYKNSIGKLREEVKQIATEKQALAKQIETLPEIEKKAQQHSEAITRMQSLETEVETLRQEKQALEVYRKKYDLDNDPEIKKAYVDPMNEAKSRSIDIIKNANLEPSFWNDLLNSQSEFKINQMIDDSNISGLNAQSLKQYVQYYQQRNEEYKKISSPEFIDAAIDAARGASMKISDTVAEETFDGMIRNFATHVDEVKKSDVNKEHNFFVYDKVVDQAKKTYDKLRQTLGSQYQNKAVLATIAQASIMTAAYRSQKQMIDFLLPKYSELSAKLLESSSAADISQTKEVTPVGDLLGNLDELKNAAAASIDDIMQDVFK